MESLGITARELDARRPGDRLGLGGRGSVADGVHLERALPLGSEGREDVLLGLFAEGLALPGEEVQEEHQGRVETAVGHCD